MFLVMGLSEISYNTLSCEKRRCMSYQVWIAFMLACWVISVSPGAGAIASMSSGLNYGFRHGYWNAIGLQLALLVQIAIVAAGAGVLFATTPWAYSGSRYFYPVRPGCILCKSCRYCAQS